MRSRAAGERAANGRSSKLSTRSRAGVLARTMQECRDDNITGIDPGTRRPVRDPATARQPEHRCAGPRQGDWLWLSNIVILVGAELDAEIARGRRIEAGHPRDEEPFLEPRDTRKLKTS